MKQYQIAGAFLKRGPGERRRSLLNSTPKLSGCGFEKVLLLTFALFLFGRELGLFTCLRINHSRRLR